MACCLSVDSVGIASTSTSKLNTMPLQMNGNIARCRVQIALTARARVQVCFESDKTTGVSMVAYRDDSRHATTLTHDSAAEAAEASASLARTESGAEADARDLRGRRSGGHRVDVDVQVEHRGFHHCCHCSVHLLSIFGAHGANKLVIEALDTTPISETYTEPHLGLDEYPTNDCQSEKHGLRSSPS